MRKRVNKRYADQDFINAAVRTDPAAFLHHSQLTLEPDKPFRKNWHIDAVLYALEQVRLGHRTASDACLVRNNQNSKSRLS